MPLIPIQVVWMWPHALIFLCLQLVKHTCQSCEFLHHPTFLPKDKWVPQWWPKVCLKNQVGQNMKNFKLIEHQNVLWSKYPSIPIEDRYFLRGQNLFQTFQNSIRDNPYSHYHCTTTKTFSPALHRTGLHWVQTPRVLQSIYVHWDPNTLPNSMR